MYDKPKICSDCGGKCCRNYPGILHPEDVQNDTKRIRSMLDSREYAVDFWNYDPRPNGRRKRTYFVRPVIKGHEGLIIDNAWKGGECVFLTKKGCRLSSDERPRQCRELEPIRDGKCLMHDQGMDSEIMKAWIPYQPLFLRLRSQIFKNEIKERTK